MLLIFAANALENQNRVLNGRGIHFDRLKATGQGRVLFDMLSVFGKCSGSDTLEFSTAQGGLENIRGIHRAFGCSGPHNRVHFVDENDNVLGLLEFVHDGFDPLLELTAILCSRYHKSQIKGDHFLVEKVFGNQTGSDLLG